MNELDLRFLTASLVPVPGALCSINEAYGLLDFLLHLVVDSSILDWSEHVYLDWCNDRSFTLDLRFSRGCLSTSVEAQRSHLRVLGQDLGQMCILSSYRLVSPFLFDLARLVSVRHFLVRPLVLGPMC